jgi:hypothetical protein
VCQQICFLNTLYKVIANAQDEKDFLVHSWGLLIRPSTTKGMSLAQVIDQQAAKSEQRQQT